MSWDGVNVTKTYNANEEYNVARSKVESNFGGSLGAVSNVGSLIPSVVGISVKDIPNMQAAITDYVEKIQQRVNQAVSTLSIDDAMAGGVAVATAEYVASLRQAVNNLTSYLLNFNEQLTAISKAYQEADESAKRQIQATASNIAADFSTR